MVIFKSLTLSKSVQPALVNGDRGAGSKVHKEFDNLSFKRDRKRISTIVSFIDEWEEVDDYEGYGHEREFPYPENKGFLRNSATAQGNPASYHDRTRYYQDRRKSLHPEFKS